MDLTRNEGQSYSGIVALSLLGLLVAVAIGWLTSNGTPIVLAVVPTILLVALYFATQRVWLLWIALFGGLVVSGLIKLYVPQLQLIRWALAPVAMVLVFHAVIMSFGAPPQGKRRSTPAVVWWALACITVFLLVSAANEVVPERFIIGLKGYFQVWGLLFALAFIPWPTSVIDRLPKAFLAIALIQLPFVLHQLIVLVPQREGMTGGIVPIDIVAGTFGASIDGGGANAVLNAFLMIVLAGVVAARQLRLISLSRAWLLGVPLLFPVLVNEAKVSVVYMLAVFFVLFGSDVIKRPVRFILSTLAAIAMVVLMVVAYTLNAPSQSGVQSWQDLIKFTYDYNIAQEEVNDELSRFGALRFWWEQHGSNDVKGTLIGHGIGYTRVADNDVPFRETVQSLFKGIPVEIDLNKNIGNTAVAAVLWETGVIGLLFAFGLLGATYRSAGRMAKRYVAVPERVVALRAVRAGAVIIFVTFFHKNVFVLDVAYQTMLMMMIGYVGYWERQASAEDNKKAS